MIQPIPCILFEVVAGFIRLSQDIQQTAWNSYEFSPQPIESLNTPDIQYLWWGGIGHEEYGRRAKVKKNSNAILHSQPENHISLGFKPLNSPVE